MDFPDPAASLGSIEEGFHNPNIVNLASSGQCSSSKRAASPASNSSPKDSSVTRVGKRRRKSRAHPKVPVTQLSANKLNFKDIVYQFTGNHTPSPPSTHFCKDGASTCKIPAVDASPCNIAAGEAHTDLSQSHDLLARLAQSLRVLETICAHFVVHGSPTKMQNQLHKSRKILSFLQALIGEPQAPTRIASEGQEIETKRDVDLQYKVQELERFLLRANDP